MANIIKKLKRKHKRKKMQSQRAKLEQEQRAIQQMSPEEAYQNVSNRPDVAILSYPVITSGKYAHRDSFVALFGKEPSEQELDYMSLENHVTKDTPPCFLWQTVTDQTVPVENSYLFAQACAQAGVPFAQHVFSEGIHGLSVATEEWLEQNIGQEEGKRYTQ